MPLFNFNAVSDFFLRLASGRVVFIGFLVYLAMAAGLMSWGERTIQNLSGKKVQVLDLCFSYSPADVHRYLSEYSPEARVFAARFNLVADMVYPLSYAFFLIVLMAWIWRPVRGQWPPFKYLHLLPLAIVIFDYLENICVVSMLFRFPEISNGLIKTGSCLTSVKWSLLGLSLLLALGGLFLRLLNSLKS